MEKVLCLKKNEISQKWIKKETSIKMSKRELESVKNLKVYWIDRKDAETNINYKQIIPYAVVKNKHNEFACYPRKGTENRLHGLWSLGIGGHINEFDKKSENFFEICENGLKRELGEEFLNFNIDKNKLKFEGIINEEYSEVGKVHIGLVFSLVTEKNLLPDKELKGLVWKKEEDFKDCKIELWSKLALNLIRRKK